MKTNFKGELAKQKCILAAIEKNWIVSVPTMETRYDLILDSGKKIYRAQCKYGDGESKNSEGSIRLQLATWQFSEFGKSKVKVYTREEIDCVLAYLPKVDKIIWLGPDKFENKKALIFRFEPSKNNQQKGINFYWDFLNWG